MQCQQCGHENEGHKFCVKCGNKLVEDPGEDTPTPVARQADDEAAAGAPQSGVSGASGALSSAAQNEHVQRVAEAGRLYWQYVLQILRKPAETAIRAHSADFVNGLITFVLYAITLPLVLYFTLLHLPFMKPSITGTVLQPALLLLLLVICTSGAVLLADRLGKGNAPFRDVIGRLGAFLVIPSALHIVALLAALVRLRLISMLALFLAFFGLIAAVSLTIFSFRRKDGQGVDPFYGILLTGFVMAVILRIIGGGIVSGMMESFRFPFF